MILEQYYLECLSHASYLLGDESTRRAWSSTPQRDVALYVDDAARRGLRIERVIETHVHADFLSGHLELAEATAPMTEDAFVQAVTEGQSVPARVPRPDDGRSARPK